MKLWYGNILKTTEDSQLFINTIFIMTTRPDTGLFQLHADRKGPYLRSLDYFGRSSEVTE